jgi:hypothetical protein
MSGDARATANDVRAKLGAAGDEYKAVRASLGAARAAAQPLVLDALRGGVGVVEVANLSGYTGESVRRLARENGIPPR